MEEHSENTDPVVTLRNATQSDISEVHEISVTSGMTSWSEEDLQNEIKKEDAFITLAQINSETAGFLHTRLITSIELVGHGEIAEFEILNVAVSAEHRRKGLARKLLTDFIADLKTRTSSGVRCFLEVRDSNFAARSLYERVGFEVVGRRKGYYTKPKEDCAVYAFEWAGE